MDIFRAADISLNKPVPRISANFAKTLQITAVGQFIKINDRNIRVLSKPKLDQIGTDEPRSSSNKNFHKHLSIYLEGRGEPRSSSNKNFHRCISPVGTAWPIRLPPIPFPLKNTENPSSASLTDHKYYVRPQPQVSSEVSLLYSNRAP